VAVLAWVASEDWPSLLILLALAALVPPAMIFFGRRATEATARQWRGLSSLSAHLLELISGLPTLRAFGRVDFGRREVAAATEGLRRSTMRTLRVAFLSSLALEVLAGLGTGLVAMMLGLRLLDGRTSLYVALAVLLVSPEVFLPLRRAAAEFHTSAEGRAAGDRIASVLERPLAVEEKSRDESVPDLRAVDLVLDGVTVEFEGRGRALGPLSVRVQPGRRLALVGPSGSGKSTALHALIGLVPLSAGRILAGPVDLADLDPDTWRRHLAWVPQRPHLFSGTIGDNVRFGRPDAGADELAAAIAASGLDEVIERLHHGLDTVVGEGGSGISSGERHRVAIARAVLHGGEVVLLDELGSHLDTQARDRLRVSIEPWLEGRTVILGAHRPDVVATIDDIVVLGPSVPAGAGASPP
jgi:ABC-type transport system involved in cytochrome bd biosynthesis fused ATPase/permease subunit